MSERALATAQKQSTVSAAPSQGRILQRKCACGNHTLAGGECERCKGTKGVLQRKLTIGASNDLLEQEADRMAEAVVGGRFVATQPRIGPLAVQRQEVEKPREQPTQFPAQEAPKQGQTKDDDEKEKLKKGGLAAAGELSKRLWDQFSNSEEGKHILAANERDWKPILKFFTDFADKIVGQIVLSALGGGAAVGGFAVAKSAGTTSSDAGVSPSTGGPVPQAPKDEQFFGLELKWEFVTPPTGITLKTPWIDSPKIPLGAKPLTPTPALPTPPVLLKAAPKIPRICTPADPQGDQGEADARSAFIFWWLQQSRQTAERRARELLDQSKLREPPKFAPSVLKPLFKRESGAGAIPDSQIIEAGLRSPGQPLDLSTRAFMEPRFGYDFSQVRVHTDSRAAESARALNAMAYTFGQDVVFGPSHYQPETSSGARLLAHELTHVVQQTDSESNRFGQTDRNQGPSPISRNNPSPASLLTDHISRLGTTSGFLVQRAPSDTPEPSGEILGGTKSTSKTIVLYHYGDLEGRESFTSPQSYPRLTDCDIATSQEEAAKYTGAPVNQKLRYKYEIRIDRDCFDNNFKNTGTRNGFSEFGTKQSIPAKYFRKVATLKVVPTGGGTPSGGSGGGSGRPSEPPAAATPATQGGSPTYGSLSPRQPDPKFVSERVELKKVGGSWVEIAGGGKQRPANGAYSFALRDGRMYGSKFGHLEASGGERVRFVGDIEFNNGTLMRWDAGSGSYKPVDSFVEEIANEAKKSGLDLEFDKDPRKSKFRPIASESKTGQRQLPVFQEKGDATLTPSGKSAPAPAGAALKPAQGGGMKPPTAQPQSAATPAMRAGAREIAQELGKNLRLMRAARVLTSILRVVDFASHLVMVYQSISMAQHSLAGEGFILTEKIKESEDLRDKANTLDAEYPAFSDWVQGMGLPIYVSGVDPDSIETLVANISELGAQISGQWIDLRKQSKRVKAALKEVTTKRQATKAILDDPVKLAALDHGGGTLNSTIVWAADQDISRIESALMQTDHAWDSVISRMNADLEFVAAWHSWLQDVGIANGKLKAAPTISVSLKEVSNAEKP